MAPEVVRSRYPRMGAFAAMARGSDPEGKLGNEFLARYVLAEEAEALEGERGKIPPRP